MYINNADLLLSTSQGVNDEWETDLENTPGSPYELF